MKIRQLKVKVSDIVEGFVDNDEEGVWGYNEKLNIRPRYQREFVYDDKQRKAVIDSVLHNFPINVMYWCKDRDGKYEIIDGQQRTISLCQFYRGDFSIDIDDVTRYYNILTNKQKLIFDNYELMIFVCEGSDNDRLKWFEVINVAGEKLTKQEIRNAVYSGPWVTSAKKYFSKTNCPAYGLASKYMKGVAIRQDYLETVLSWNPEGKGIEDFMAKHRDDENADKLWGYFTDVIDWVEKIFPPKMKCYRREMKGVPWGLLYNVYKDVEFDPKEMEVKVKTLMKDAEITNKSGIYEYVFDGQEKHLSLRSFTEPQKREAYEKQEGKCANCGEFFEFEQMEGDHIIPWCDGGKTIEDNLQMLCRKCNNDKRAR